MTDWTTTHPGGGSVSWKCIAAGNDLIMPGIREALEKGDLKEQEVRDSAERILSVVLRTE